jgi:hypothetical protein
MHKNAKFKPKYKVTPDVHKQIESLVKELGPWQRLDKNGNKMFEKHTEFKGTSDFSVSLGSYTKHISTGKKPLLINHSVYLIEAFQKKGQQGINEYMDFYNKIKETQKEYKDGATD